MDIKKEIPELWKFFNNRKPDTYDELSFYEFLDICFEVIENQFGLSESKVKLKNKKREIAEKRFMIFAKIKQKFGSKISLSKIGNALGGKNHATVLNGLRTHMNLLETNSPYREKYNNFSEMVDQKLKGILSFKDAVDLLSQTQKDKKSLLFENLISALVEEALCSKVITLSDLQKRIEGEILKNGQK